MEKKNLKKVHFVNNFNQKENYNNIDNNKLKKFITTSKKEDKVNLINKLVQIKEKYNKLINEKYELDFSKKKIKKKIKEVKSKILKLKKNASSDT